MENSTANVLYNYKDPTNVLTAFLIISIGSMGVYNNVSVIHGIIKLKKTKSELTSFNLVCLFKASANLYILITTFFGDFIPVILLGHAIYPPYVETVIIAISNSIYVADEYTTLLIAANRSVAIFHPVFYRKVFGLKETMGYLVAFFVIRGVWFSQQLYTKPEACYYTFDPESLAWGYTAECVNLQDLFIIFAFFAAIVTTLLNVLTIIKTRRRNIAVSPGFQNTRSAQTNRSIKLVIQTMCQDSLFIIDLLATFKLSGLSSNRFWTFFCGSLIWLSLHSLDGFFMMAFNGRFTTPQQEVPASPNPSISTIQAVHERNGSRRPQQNSTIVATF